MSDLVLTFHLKVWFSNRRARMRRERREDRSDCGSLGKSWCLVFIVESVCIINDFSFSAVTGFLRSRNALISLPATSGSSLDGYLAHHTQSTFPLAHHRDKNTFPWAHLNSDAMSTCPLDHTESLMRSYQQHGQMESDYRLVPSNTDESILMANRSQWASHQSLIGQNVSRFWIRLTVWTVEGSKGKKKWHLVWMYFFLD